jgi:hypothetical protein
MVAARQDPDETGARPRLSIVPAGDARTSRAAALAPARGILWAVALALPFWAIIGATVRLAFFR